MEGRREPVLEVSLLGNEKVSYGEISILDGKNSITKMMKLLLILLYNGKAGVSRDKLLEDLYGNEVHTDLGNSLRVAVHRLKKTLVELGLPEHDYIVVNDGIYYWDGPMDVVVDVHVFKDLVARAEKTEEEEERILLLKEACKLYTGEFLQKFSGDAWVLIESIFCKQLYAWALQELCDLLFARRDYHKVISLVEPACRMYPFDEWQAVKIDCYIALDRQKEAMALYEATAKMLFDEMGVAPAGRMAEQYKLLSEYVRDCPQQISEIKARLTEAAGGVGALFCYFPGFRDAYRMLRRGIERYGHTVFMVVFTLRDPKGGPVKDAEKLEAMSELLRKSIQYSLRTSDSYTKYNNAQYLVMLVGANEKNCHVAIDRILTYFSSEQAAFTEYLEYGLVSL